MGWQCQQERGNDVHSSTWLRTRFSSTHHNTSPTSLLSPPPPPGSNWLRLRECLAPYGCEWDPPPGKISCSLSAGPVQLLLTWLTQDQNSSAGVPQRIVPIPNLYSYFYSVYLIFSTIVLPWSRSRHSVFVTVIRKRFLLKLIWEMSFLCRKLRICLQIMNDTHQKTWDFIKKTCKKSTLETFQWVIGWSKESKMVLGGTLKCGEK